MPRPSPRAQLALRGARHPGGDRRGLPARAAASRGRWSRPRSAKALSNPSPTSCPCRSSQLGAWRRLPGCDAHGADVQPVVPFTLNDDWNLIGRWIMPFVSQPSLSPGLDSTFGLSDVLFSAFFSPRKLRRPRLGRRPGRVAADHRRSDFGQRQMVGGTDDRDAEAIRALDLWLSRESALVVRRCE